MPHDIRNGGSCWTRIKQAQDVVRKNKGSMEKIKDLLKNLAFSFSGQDWNSGFSAKHSFNIDSDFLRHYELQFLHV